MARKRRTRSTPNRGSFTPGLDPRRHVFTVDECSRGGQASFAYLLEWKPWVLLGLRKKLRQQRRHTGQGR